MNGRDDDKPAGGGGRELVPDAWRELDDTLADGPAPVDVPGEAKAWLADQRFLHGLLRALHTQDAAAHEGRVAAILERIDREATVEPRRRWLVVAAVALLVACVGVWAALPASLPTAEAAVERAVAELARDVARRFVLRVTPADGKSGPKNEFAVMARPGGRFRVEGKLNIGSMQLGQFRLGCDGEELWFVAANGAFRHTVPLAERERLQQRLGDVLELGYLDVHDLVRKLPGDFALRVVGRESNAGRDVLRIEATRARTDAGARLRSAWLLCDEATGMVTQIEAEIAHGSAARRVSFEYVGEEPGTVDFRRPW